MDQPQRAQAGQELLRQQSGAQTAAMNQSPNIDAIDQQIGDVSFTEGLAQRRARLAQLTQSTQNIQGFQQGVGAQNLQAIAGMERAPGENPVDILRSLMGMENFNRDILSQAASREIQGMNAVTDYINSERDAQIKERELALKEYETFKDQLFTANQYGYKVIDGIVEPMTDEEKINASKTGQEAFGIAIKQGAKNYLNSFKSKAERESAAEQILQAGGWEAYRDNAELQDLINADEKIDLEKQSNLLLLLEQAKQSFEKFEGGIGTGPIEALIPGFLAGTKSRELRRLSERLKATFAEMISGKTISDKEMARLENFLPTSSKNEIQNLEDINNLMNGIKANQELFEIAKRKGLTANEAYQEFGQEILAKYGQSEKKSLNADDVRKKLKQKGYSDQEIEEFIKMKGL